MQLVPPTSRMTAKELEVEKGETDGTPNPVYF
jgi:hypothetical protein